MIFAEGSHDPLSPRVLIFVEKLFGSVQRGKGKDRRGRGVKER